MSARERPIVFVSSLIPLIQKGVKTQTRRIAKNEHCPYGEAGDSLWVRRGRFGCKADSPMRLRIVSVRRERLHAITEQDAKAEGVQYEVLKLTSARKAFRLLWVSLYGEQNWRDNPWVWTLTFATCEADGVKFSEAANG